MEDYRLDRTGYRLELEDAFDGPDLDRSIWLPHHLPHWSNRVASAARYSVGPSGLSLLIEADQPPWYPDGDRFTRISTLQTGGFSGRLGSTIGQHHFRPELVVREEQPTVALYTPLYGLFECRARALADPANMVALWMIGFEDEPERSGEICVFEIFGKDVSGASCLVGMGVHPWQDPALAEEFEKVRLQIDATQYHDYAVEWTTERVRFYVDERLIKSVEQAPAYPMQFMLDIFEFAPGPGLPSPPQAYPKVFEVEWFRGWRRAD
jgi:hypothetical protein